MNGQVSPVAPRHSTCLGTSLRPARRLGDSFCWRPLLKKLQGGLGGHWRHHTLHYRITVRNSETHRSISIMTQNNRKSFWINVTYPIQLPLCRIVQSQNCSKIPHLNLLPPVSFSGLVPAYGIHPCAWTRNGPFHSRGQGGGNATERRASAATI